MKHLISFVLVVSYWLSQNAMACPVCYGANDTAAAGMNSAIIFMLGITGFVLAAIMAFFLWMWRRSRRQPAEISEEVFVDEKGVLHARNDSEEIPSVKRSD